MFSALKKLTHRSPDAGNGSPQGPQGQTQSYPAGTANGINAMNLALQRKFAKGVNYNLKLIIKGDRNTGKSCLLKRLQGGEFIEEYSPTDEIQVASIQWNYKATDDIIKVEVWDIVDKAKKRKKIEGLKLGTNSSVIEMDESMQPALDAEFVDVYKGTHAVVLMFDVTKLWTFEYVEKELPKIPAHIPVLVLANFIDRGHHRVVTREQASSFVELFDRGQVPQGKEIAEIRYAESSMRNSFGLKFLHKFLNFPYLLLQRESLQLQLELNKQEILATLDELDAFQESCDGQYDDFINGLTKKRRHMAEALAPSPTVDVVVGQPSNTFKNLTTTPKLTPSPKPVDSFVTPVSIKHSSPGQQSNGTKAANDTSKFISSATRSPSKGARDDVDSFIPDTGVIDNFFDDDHSQPNHHESSEDEESEAAINPMVSGFADDLDQDDFKPIDSIQNSPRLLESSDEETAKVIHQTRGDDKKSSKPSRPKSAKALFEVPVSLSISLEGNSIEAASVEADSEIEEKKKKHKKKKSKKRASKSPSRERDELEDFLNGSFEGGQPPDATVYEAL